MLRVVQVALLLASTLKHNDCIQFADFVDFERMSLKDFLSTRRGL